MGLPKQDRDEGAVIPVAATILRTPQGELRRWVSLAGGRQVHVEDEALSEDQNDINAFLGWASTFDIGAAVQVTTVRAVRRGADRCGFPIGRLLRSPSGSPRSTASSAANSMRV